MLLPAEIRAAIVAHGRFCLPEEACGLLAVDDEDRLCFVYCLTNAAASAQRFRVEPGEHYGAVRHAERHGWTVAGAFHSHVATPPRPSPRDVAAAPGPGWLHLLVGPMSAAVPQVRGYRIDAGSVWEVPLTSG